MAYEDLRIKLDGLRPSMAKVLLDEDKRRRYGHIVARAIELAGLTDKEACDRLGMNSISQLSRWKHGHENPQVWRLSADELLGPALVVAEAEALGKGTVIKTVITIGGEHDITTVLEFARRVA